MKIRLPVHAKMGTLAGYEGEYVVLKATCQKDNDALRSLFSRKAEWEKRNGGRDFFLTVLLDLPYQRRTFRQNAAVWKLVTVIFESMDGRLPAEEEKYGLYLDLLEAYADKVPNRIKGGLRPVHISEANSLEGSKFIDGLLYHLATECDLSYEAQTTVQEVLHEWEAWRGGLEKDHADYAGPGQTRMLTEAEWRKKHVYSEASGRGGTLHSAHIVSSGSDAADTEASWNWVALAPEEHEQQHRLGWDEFLRIYPHLKGRVERARRLAQKGEIQGTPKRAALDDLVNQAMEV
jgi:hypothetical protein